MTLKAHRITLLRELAGTNGQIGFEYQVPAGTPGLHIGIRTHFDLGHIAEHGVWPFTLFGGSPALPTFELLEAGTDYEDHGEWDGEQGEFTDMGWMLQPVAGFRKDWP